VFPDTKRRVATPQGPFYQELGQNIQRARKAARITQAELARAVRLSRTSITNIERGRQPVPVELLDRICRVLGVSLADTVPAVIANSTADTLPRIQKMEPGKRAWVNRILNNSLAREEVPSHATALRSSTKESSGTSDARKSRRRSGAD
jgi:transcriptional regulator with XRE-family HTH domain